jgi:hypothetical protein
MYAQVDELAKTGEALPVASSSSNTTPPIEQLVSSHREQANEITNLNQIAAQREAQIGGLQAQLMRAQLQIKKMQQAQDQLSAQVQQERQQREQLVTQHNQAMVQVSGAPERALLSPLAAYPLATRPPPLTSVTAPAASPPLHRPRTASQRNMRSYTSASQQRRRRRRLSKTPSAGLGRWCRRHTTRCMRSSCAAPPPTSSSPSSAITPSPSCRPQLTPSPRAATHRPRRWPPLPPP